MAKAVITGIGVVGPTGLGIQPFWDALLTRKCVLGPITRFDTTDYPCTIGGEIGDIGFESLLDARKIRTAARVSQLALAATELALRDARLPDRFYDSSDLGVVVGTALGGWSDGEKQYAVLLARGARRVNPFIANGSAHYGPAAEIANAFAVQGPQLTFAAGCAAATQAIAHAAYLIESGQLDACIAGGAETPLSAVVLAGMGRTLELATRNDQPELACRPFDRDHTGMVLSEGSCVFVLESADRSASRGAKAYAEIVAGSGSCDARGLFAFDESGETGARTIHKALRLAAVDVPDIDYVCAHANSSPAFDRKEAIVLRKAFGEFAARIPVSSIKGVLGHPFGASGAFQLAAVALAMRHGKIPPTANLDEPEAGCDLAHVRGEPMSRTIRHALITSYGYGGVNAFLVVAAPRDR